MTTIAADAGYSPAHIACHDVSLMASAVGTMLSNRSLDELGICVDGEPLDLDRYGAEPIPRLAWLVYTILRLRLAQKNEGPYWSDIRTSVALREKDMVAKLVSDYTMLHSRLGGIAYEVLDVWEALERYKDDPHTVIALNPPTYKGAYEKFFNTGGHLTWNQPTYKVFDSVPDIPRVMAFMANQKALILCKQQSDAENPAGPPVFAMHLRRGRFVYMCTNRPDEVADIIGKGVKPLAPKGSYAPLKATIIPTDHPISLATTVLVEPIEAGTAQYYRDLFMHKLDGSKAGDNFAIILDGYLAGIGGFDSSTITRPYNDKYDDCIMLMFATAAPHAWRLTRLVKRLIFTHTALDRLLNPRIATIVKGIVTAQLTPHPEVKGNRGMMTLISRKPDPVYGNRLIYWAAASDESYDDALRGWLSIETKYQANRVALGKGPAVE